MNLGSVMLSQLWYQNTNDKRKKDKLDYIKKKKKVFASKDIIKEVKRKSTEWEKMFVICLSDKGLVSGTL